MTRARRCWLWSCDQLFTRHYLPERPSGAWRAAETLCGTRPRAPGRVTRVKRDTSCWRCRRALRASGWKGEGV